TFSEGRRKLHLHFRRERDSRLVTQAKSQFTKLHGRLYCEVCGFDFKQTYGELGDQFIEAHHRQPLSELPDEGGEAQIHDLAMVCANCHRMLHRRKPWMTIEQLRALIQEQ